MPYTAPCKQSPSAQQIDHAPTNSHAVKAPQSPPGRVYLPRSYSSTAYLRKHRRSPSLNKSFTLPAVESCSRQDHAADSLLSLRQSPPPLTDAPIPPGAMISPPESASNSSDEDSTYLERNDIRLGDLEAAVRSIEQKRRSSPESPRRPDLPPPPSRFSSAVTRIDRPGKPADLLPPKKFFPDSPHDPLISSPEESDRDDPKRKTPLVRKKSGEPLRPALRGSHARRRPSSMPGTPTYSKAVHFDSQLEHIRHFLQLDKPLAVSAETSPADEHDAGDEFPFGHGPSGQPHWELRLVNFPKDPTSRARSPVRLERLALSSDNTNLVGVVAVANLAFHKQVVARFTFDYWKTVSEVTAEYTHDVGPSFANDGCDRFSFSIKLADQANLENKTMLACIRYTVGGKEYWDNNNLMNYQAKFLPSPKSNPEQRASPRPRAPLPRSRTFVCSHMSRPHSMPVSFDDFSDMDSYLTFGRVCHAKGDSLPRGGSHDIEPAALVRRGKQSRQAFGNRYDFGASLSAAMQTKPTHDRTTLTTRAKSGTENTEDHSRKKEARLPVEKSTPVSEITRQSALSEPAKSSSLVSDKPRHDSTVYKELVDKYCFFGSPKGSPKSKRQPSPNKAESSTQNNNSNNLISSSPSITPSPSPRLEAALGMGSCPSSTSPAGPSAGYPYHQPMQSFFLKESQTSTAIRG